MPKMKLLLNTSEDEPAVRRAVCASAGPHHRLNKEAVFEWFGLHLDPVRRLEFMCGLLHMCQPLELRFLGSYLEDLARKDYHILRDFECRANTPSELGNLTDVTDPVVRSKMLVCLSLLGSDSRECAGILFQTLGRVDPAYFSKTSDYCLAPSRVSRCQDGGEAPVDGGSEAAALEQLALLFTMASLHPAFHFHQRQMLRAQLDKIHFTVEEQRQSVLRRTAQTLELPTQGQEHVPLSVVDLAESGAPHTSCQSHRFNCEAPQKEAVHIERIVLRSILRTKVDREYNFEVMWSDSSCSSVTKTHSELENFLLKLPKDQCNESFERGLLQLLKKEENKRTEEQLRNHFLSAPPVFTQSTRVWCFFTADGGRCPGSRQAYHEPGSDGSSQDEEPFVEDYKKHRNKSPSLETPVESLAAQRGESISTSRTLAMHRGKGKPKGAPNGSLAATLQWKDAESRSAHSAETMGTVPLSSHSLQSQMEAIRAECTDTSALPFMPYSLPPGATSFPSGAPPLLPGAPTLSKPCPGPVRMHLPPAMAGPGLVMEPEKGDLLPTFGVSPMSLPASDSSGIQPLVQRFKSLSHVAGSTATPPCVPQLHCPPPSEPSVCPPACLRYLPIFSHLCHARIHLQGQCASGGDVPNQAPSLKPGGGRSPCCSSGAHTHPGPAPSPSPALTPSMAHSSCTSSSPSVDGSVDGPGQRALPVLSCGVCGCQCAGCPVSASPLFFHQVGAGARPMLGMPHLFPLTNYLPQAQAPHQPQPNGTTLPPSTPPTARCTPTPTCWEFSSKWHSRSVTACTLTPSTAQWVCCL
uniref:Zinc finger CCHC domain-containing protein 2 n=1 Tax=Neogobius melanostomus TaxID=47308 RepID=A0A8C6U662_9GOBI